MATTPNIEPKSNGFFNGATELAQYLVSQGKNDAKNELAVNQKLIEIDGVQHYWDSSNLRWRPITAPIPDDEPVPERSTAALHRRSVRSCMPVYAHSSPAMFCE